MRVISPGFRDLIEATNGTDVIVIFATITHPALIVPVTVNSDVVDYAYNGYVYKGCAFALSLLTDDENMPRAQAAIQNVDQAIGAAVLAMATPPKIKIEIMVRSDFDDSDPRQPIGTPTVEFSAPNLTLQNVKCDAMMMTADIVGKDFSTEPWPTIRSTQDKLPGLYR